MILVLILVNSILLVSILVGIALTLLHLRRTKRKINSVSHRLDGLAPFFWATTSLNRVQDITHPLPNWNDWSMPPDLLMKLLELVDKLKSTEDKVIVEFGSGISTIVLASKLKAVGGKLISFEHDAAYAAQIKNMLSIRGLSKFVDLRVTEITSIPYHTYEYPWYDINPNDLPDFVDLVIIDGPPNSLGATARLPAAELMIERLKPGGSIVLDDANRSGEKAIKQFLKKKYEYLAFIEPPSIRGILIVTSNEE